MAPTTTLARRANSPAEGDLGMAGAAAEEPLAVAPVADGEPEPEVGRDVVPLPVGVAEVVAVCLDGIG